MLPKFTGDSMNLAGILGQHGEDGWEMCGMMRMPNGTGLVMMKRPVQREKAAKPDGGGRKPGGGK